MTGTGGRQTQPGDGQPRLPEHLAEWIATTTGGAVARADRLPGGNRRQAWLVDIDRHGGDRQRLFLRYEEPDPALEDDYFVLAREAGFYRALSDTDVAIPRFVGLHPSGRAMMTAGAAGSSSYARSGSADARQAIAEDLMRHLARLHRIDPTLLRFLPEEVPEAVGAAIGREIAIWEHIYRSTGSTDALVEFGLRWLRANLPDAPEPPRLVHGDAGPGNFLFEGAAVTALIDWELAHIGDPHEDIAWLSMRTVLEPFPDFPACLDAYERAAGRRVDRDRVRYHRVLVQWRVAIIRHRDHGADRANSLVSRALNRRLLVSALAEAMGLPLPAAVPAEASDTPLAREYDAALAMLRDEIGPAVSAPFAMAKVKSVARILKYLRECDRLQDAHRREEVSDLGRLLGGCDDPGDDPGAGRRMLAARIAAGDFPDDRLLGHFARQVGRETQLMQTAMGSLAWRPFPPLERPGS